MNDRRKLLALLSGILVVLALATFFALRSVREGDANANVAEFAKSIDHTKANTPSVPAERLSLGRSGGQAVSSGCFVAST